MGGISDRSNFLPQGGSQRGPPGGGPQGGSRELFGLHTWRTNLRIRPRGYFFMLRSILILPDLEIPLKSQTITKKRIYKKSMFSNFDQIMIWGYGSAWFFTLIPNPTSKPPQTRLKNRFYQKSDFYGTSTLNSGATKGGLLRRARRIKIIRAIPFQIYHKL